MIFFFENPATALLFKLEHNVNFKATSTSVAHTASNILEQSCPDEPPVNLSP